jgi:uncharacterized LabA/DUF88 family protein
MKTGLYVDISDLYFKLQKKFGVGKLNYVLLKERCENLTLAIAYGCQSENEASPFIHYLRSLGFITKYKKPYTLNIGDRKIQRCSWGVGVATDVLTGVNDHSIDNVIICSSNPDLIPLYKKLGNLGINVTVIGCNVPKSVYKYVTNLIELSIDDLETKEE